MRFMGNMRFIGLFSMIGQSRSSRAGQARPVKPGRSAGLALGTAERLP
jgi:hypothetical protein